MDPTTLLRIVQLALDLFSNHLTKAPTSLISNGALLEHLATATAKAYFEETGQPIDPTRFTYEPPLGAIDDPEKPSRPYP